MFFASDNWAGAHSKVAERLLAASSGFASAYGTSELDQSVEAKFSEIFEREVAVFFVATGTAANSLSLASVQKPGGISFCHTEAHVAEDECGAPDFFSGARLATVEGALGKIDPKALATKIARFPQDAVHHGRAAAVTITQATEIGTVYSLAEIDAIASITKANGLPLHMDGARFANALVALGATPAEMTWKRGIDILSFGGTKNGCWMADAVVILNPDVGKDLRLQRQRAGQTFSKARFISAQFEAYFTDDLWLRMAGHANQMAALLAETIEDATAGRLAWLPQANEVFAVLDRTTAEKLRAAGAKFHEWGVPQGFDGHLGDNEAIYRFVASFATSTEEIDRLGQLLA